MKPYSFCYSGLETAIVDMYQTSASFSKICKNACKRLTGKKGYYHHLKENHLCKYRFYMCVNVPKNIPVLAV